MPPGKRKAGSQEETKSQLSVGDLVLAKVKGFPAWPAKICKPEDWDRSPDPKKFFVQFFGTSEIAFVAPADIQVFNLESKNKLVVRSRGKCAKDFGRAVEEICKAYELLHGKISEKHGEDADGTLQDNRLDESSKPKDLGHNRESEEGERGDLVSEAPSKSFFQKDERSPSSCPEGGKRNQISVYFRGKTSDSKIKASSVNENTQKLLRKYESGSKFMDGYDCKAADSIDGEREKNHHSPVSDSKTLAEKRSKISRKPEKVPVGDSHKKVKSSTINLRDNGVPLSSEVHMEKKILMSNKKRGLDVPGEPQAKRIKHDGDHGETCSVTNVQRSDKMSMEKVSMTGFTEGTEHKRSYGFVKKGELHYQKNTPTHTHSRRRTFRIDEDEDDEVRRTPVHSKYDVGSSPKSNGKFYKDKMPVNKTGTRLQHAFSRSEERRATNVFRPNNESKMVESKVRSSAEASIKTCTVSSRSSNEIHCFNRAVTQKEKPPTFDKVKGMQKSGFLVNAKTENRANANYSAESSSLAKGFSYDERSANSFAESNGTEYTMSMRDLIAVAQAKRREANLQGHSNDRISGLLSSPATFCERSPSPLSEMQHISDLNLNEKVGGESVSSAYATEEHEPIASPEILPVDVRNDATEASVARDALEGMLETLSKTRESIGRATRLAINCAQYGIFNEVIDLLVRKLESETNLHSKVALFFLVDSITQWSHNQKGVSGDFFLPSVQNALVRLLAAVVPAGSVASENRRQCLKVLNLWLERKIFPESVLHPLMDGIDSQNDESKSASALPLRRPFRTERSVDDPIRDMEGILDEYGSNVAINLPGLISTHIFEEEEGLLGNDTPSDFASAIAYHSNYTDGRRLGLEEAHENKRVSFQQHAEAPEISENTDYVYFAQRAVPLPPLPLDSPPSLPPLPLSPPPLSLPPLPPSPPPPPPPSPPPPPPPPPYPQHSSFPQSDSPTIRDYGTVANGHAHALQQSPGFSSGVEWNGQANEFARSSVHIDHQMGRSSHQFQSTGTSFSQGSEESCLVPSHPVLAPYSSSTQPKHHFPSANLMSEHHNSYSFQSDPDGRVRYFSEEHEREHAGNVILSSQQISWDSGGSAPSGVAYVQDGLHRPPHEFHPPHSVPPASGPHNYWGPS